MAAGGGPARGRLSAVRAFAVLHGLASLRSASSLAVMLAMPVFVTGFVGAALRGYTTPALMVGAHGAGSSADAGRLLEGLAADPHVRVRRYDDAEAMRLAVHRGRLHGGLLVAPGWRAGEPLDYYASKAGAGATVLRAILDRELARLGRPEAAVAALAVVDGAELASPPIGYQYTAPSNLVLFVVVASILSSQLLVALRRSGMGRRLRASPASAGELALAIAVGPFQVLAVQSAILVAVGALAFGVRWGSPAGMLLVTGGLVLLGTSAALFAGTWFRSLEQVTAIGPFVSITLGMLSGCMWPLEVVPDEVAAFGRIFPSAWALDAYLALVFGRASWRAVLPHAAGLACAATVFAALALLRLRRQL